MSRTTKQLAVVLLVMLGGCDLVGSKDNSISVTGRVIVAGSDEPIEGLGVSLGRNGGFGINQIVATTRTGADGTFHLVHDPGETLSPLLLTVNDEPYNAQFGQFARSVPRGQRRDFGTIALTEL